MFAGCTNLDNAIIPNSVTAIEEKAFEVCYYMTTVTIGTNVKDIGAEAFQGCDNLIRVNCYALTPPQIEDTNCFSCYENATLYVRLNRLNAYQSANVWSLFGNYDYCESLNFEYNGIYYTYVLPSYPTYPYVKVTYGSEKYNGDIVIPETVHQGILTYTVSEIGDSAFMGCSGLTSIYIPATINKINKYAFGGCLSLQKVIIPDLGHWCSKISFYGPFEAEEANSNPLNHAHHLFLNEQEITDLVIPSNVTSIAKLAFQGCTGLNSVTIPPSLGKIDSYAFSGCDNLNRVNISNLEKWCQINFSGGICSSYHLFLNGVEMTDLTVPESISQIKKFTFMGCKSLINAHLHDGITSIGEMAFRNCSNLRNISLPNEITEINNSVFSGCSALSGIVIPNNVTKICSYSFDGCKELADIIIPSAVAEIKNYAFRGCESFDEMDIPATVNTLERGVFFGCKNLKKVNIAKTVHIPDTYELFEECEKLEVVLLPDSIESIGERAFYMCSSIEQIILPKSLRTIGLSAFSDCSSLLRIDIPDHVESLGLGAFYGCVGLKEVRFGESIQLIGQSAFKGCKSLEEIVIPESVTQVSWRAFCDCDSMSRVTCKAIVPPAMYESFTSWADDPINIPLYVPQTSLEAYRQHDSWGKFQIIEAIPSDLLGDMNGDGNISISDVTALIDLLLSGGEMPLGADVNGDNKISISDVTSLIDLLLSEN